MKTYVVGGAIRDALLGLPVQDRDYVVVGATPEQMRARGFTPVGKDFPVFLHPETHEEYALARTERKTAPGYKGFVFHADADVTLEQDLLRRDLTINAMAQADDGSLVDPFGGQRDLQARIFRHVSEAFAEDPVRILRLARFAARFTDFTVAPETNALMQKMVEAGEVDALVPERVWQELARGLMEAKPSRMFEVLRACGALARILPELDALWNIPLADTTRPASDTGAYLMHVIDHAARDALSLPIRFAALTHDLGRAAMPAAQAHQEVTAAARSVELVDKICKRLKIPNDCRDLAVMTAREHAAIAVAIELDAESIVKLFERSDAFRKPQRFADMLRATQCCAQAHAAIEQPPFLPASWLQTLLANAQAVDAGAIARLHGAQPQRIAEAVHAARVSAVVTAMSAGAKGSMRPLRG